MSQSTGLTHDDYTVGWVCALPKEQTAATAILDHTHPDLPKPPSDYNTYTLGSIGDHNIVIACLPKGRIGGYTAASVATQMINTFPSIKFGLMVGIGGGIPPNVRLGDVVISTPVEQYPGVVQWDFGKTEKNGNFKRTGALNNPPSTLLTALTKLETIHEMKGSKVHQYLGEMEEAWPNLVPKYTRSDFLNDPLFSRCDSDHSRWQAIFSALWNAILTFLKHFFTLLILLPSCSEQLANTTGTSAFTARRKRSRDMCIHYGLIASGNQVVKDAKFRDSLNESLGGNVLCIEMEAAGLMNNFPCLVIRGICDYADSGKSKDWQEYAAAIAAACTKELLEYVQPSDIDRERPVKDILGHVLDSVSSTGENVKHIKSKLNRDEDMKICNWLTSVDYSPQHADYTRRRELGTGQWLLNSMEYQYWLETEKQTLFCPGIPGAGKTIITAIVIDDLYKRFSNNTAIGIAYVYCNFQHQDDQRADGLLLSLLKQLVQKWPSVSEDVKALYFDHQRKGTRPSHDEITRTIHCVTAAYSRVFIVIDALDECQVSNGSRQQFLSDIFNLQTKGGTCIFATSRFVWDITHRFKDSTKLEIRARDEDVQRYLDNNMFKLPAFVGSNRQLQEKIKATIIRAVDGMFLLAQLYLDSLDDKISIKDMEDALVQFQTQHAGLDESQRLQLLSQAYHKAMERIKSQKPGFRTLAENILSWITCSKRPMTISELQCALAVEINKSELDEMNLPHIGLMVSVCAGLVTVDEESHIIRLIHYTTQEFLREKQYDWFPDAENKIATTCVTYLSFSIFNSGFCQTENEIAERLGSNYLYDYAARNWGHHARISSIRGGSLVLSLLESANKVAACSQVMIYKKCRIIDETQMTGLHLAAYFGLRNLVPFLLERQIDLNSRDRYGRTPLSWAAGCGFQDVMELLLDQGAEFRSLDDFGWTPLSWAAGKGHVAAVKLLIDRGAGLDSKDISFKSPLSLAAENGHEMVVELLLSRGAAIDSDNNVTPPLRWATERGHKGVVGLLLDKGARQNGYVWSPLITAAGHGHEDLVRLMLDKGADIESRDRYGRTPLLSATESGHEAVVRLLLHRGANFECRDNDGWTPLSWAENYRHDSVIKLLLDKGAVPEMVNHGIWSPANSTSRVMAGGQLFRVFPNTF